MTNSAPLPCPLCGADAASHAATVRRAERVVAYDRCVACGLVYQRERPLADALKALYSDAYFDLRRGTEEAPTEEIIRRFRLLTSESHLSLIERYIVPGAILDVGCGEGYLLETALRRGWGPRVGLDVSEAAVRLTSRVAETKQAGLADAQIPTGTFDAVTMLDSFEHVPLPLPALRAAGRALKAGGIIYIVTPDAGSWAARLMRNRWYQYKPDEHVCLYTARTLRRSLELVGFENVQFVPVRKFLTLEFVASILATTNPTLARTLRRVCGGTAVWKSVRSWPTGDLAVVASRGTAGSPDVAA